MSDGRVIIDTVLNTKPIEEGTKKLKKELNSTKSGFSETTKETQKLEREMEKLKHQLGGEVPEATKEAYQEMYKLKQEIRNTSRQYGSYSQETQKARNALNEYVLGLDDATFKQVYMRSSLGLTDAQLTQQANSIKLNARMIKLMGSQTEILTKQMQGLKDKGIKPKDMLPASTLGQFKMLNETIQASGNPIYKLSAGYRALGASMEQTIKGWSAQKMAVKLAGDDMVKYGLLLRGITAGQASLAMAFPIVGIAAVMAYGAIFGAAIQANEGLQKLADTAKGKLGQAFKPLLDVAGAFLKAILNITIKIADMMIKFEQIYPIMSKVIAAIALLTPAMTLLLLPLNMGIGLLAGWKVAINGAWVAIGGIASAIGIATSTFLAIAGVIGVVAWSFMYLMKTNETFRNAVIPIWETVSNTISKVITGIGDLIAKVFVSRVEATKKALNGMVELFLVTLPNAFKQGGIEGVVTAIGGMLSNLVNVISTKSTELLKAGGEIIKPILLGIQANLPQILATGSQFITNLINGISIALPQIIQKMNETRLLILNTIASNLPQIMQTGVQIITLLIQGIAAALPLLLNIGIQIITAIINTIVANLPTIISTGITVLKTLLDGIIQALPVLIGAGVQVLNALVDAITENLPLIIDAGLQILNSLVNAIIELLPMIITAGIGILIALINGITEAIPQLIAMLPTIINTIITVIAENLPLIIEAGIKILVALIEGLIQALPQLIAMLPQITSTIVNVLIQNLPLLINAGIQLLVAIINGLIQAIPQLIAAVPQIASALIGAFKNVDWASIGRNIISGIGQGIENAKSALFAKATNLANSITSKIKGALDIHSPSRVMRDQVGKNIALGIAEGIKRNTKNVVSSIEVLSVEAINAGISKADSYKELGKVYIDNLKDGVENRQSLLIEAFKKTVDDGVATFVGENKASESEYKQAGDNLVKAYTESIKEGTNEALSKISDNITSITDEFQQAYDDIIKKRDDFQGELLGYGDMFTKEDDGDIELNNIENQTNALLEYESLLEKLKSRGATDAFLDQITSLDVETGTELVKELLRLDSGELQQYVQAWQTKQDIAKGLAEKFYAEQLTTLDEDFNKKIDEAMINLPTTMQDIGKNAMQGFMDGMDSQMTSLIEKSSGIAESVLTTFQSAFDIHSPSRVFRDLIGSNIVKGIGAGMENEIPTLTTGIDTNIANLVAKLKNTVDYETARTTASIAASANKAVGTSTSTITNNNENGLTVQIENFNNNSEQDIDDIGSELAFAIKKRIK